MKKMTNESIVSPRIQKAVQRLAADEYYSAQYYMLAPFAVQDGQYGALCELFAQQEAQSRARFARLVEWSAKYGVEVPFSEAEMKKRATPELAKKAQGVKKGQAAGLYIDKAKEVEEAAMKSYKDTIDIDGLEYFTDLQSLLWQNYYDRGDAMSRLQTARVAFDASCDLVMN